MQASAQVPHASHFSRSTMTGPFFGPLEIAFCGQAGMQL
jgi:hypothetical protein